MIGKSENSCDCVDCCKEPDTINMATLATELRSNITVGEVSYEPSRLTDGGIKWTLRIKGVSRDGSYNVQGKLSPDVFDTLQEYLGGNMSRKDLYTNNNSVPVVEIAIEGVDVVAE